MRILTVLTFYHPHWTGLTAIATRLAEGFVANGHRVTVLTTRHAPDLSAREVVGGVDVIRLDPVARLSRGFVTPALPQALNRLLPEHDVVHIHTPLPEAPLVAALARLRRRPLLMTHQGDLVMPAGVANQAIQKVGTALLHAGGRLATVISPLNEDYARHSRFLRPFARKLVPILPPVEIPEPRTTCTRAWRKELGLAEAQVIGFAGRWVEEKGFDYLLRALPLLRRTNPRAELIYAGDHAIDYEDFYRRCEHLVAACGEHLKFVGLIRDRSRLASFYSMCDVFALPSRTDSFAAVQVEAMLSGTPVVAADIPGARVPVQLTGMGGLVRPRDAPALAAGLREVLEAPSRFRLPRTTVEAAFNAGASIERYEELLARLVSGYRP
jgi:glycosyltransferase involved in cell wall biosynthesis